MQRSTNVRVWARGRGSAGDLVLGEVDRCLVPPEERITAYFLDRLFVSHGRAERLLRQLMAAGGARLARPLLFRAAWRLDAASLALRPARGRLRQGDPRGWAAAAELLREAAALAPELLAVEDGAVGRSILLRDYGGSGRGRLLLFPFGSEGEAPAIVVKLRHRQAEGRLLRREWQALRTAADALPPELASGLPAPLDYRSGDHVEVLVLSHVPGRSAYVELRNTRRPSRHLERHFTAAADWLAAFHLGMRQPGRVVTFGDADAEFARVSAAAGARAEPPWFRELLRRAAGQPVPLTAAHGDYWARNLMVAADDGAPGAGSGRRSAVVDWEHFREEASPADDLLHFPLSYGLSYRWRGYRPQPIPRAFQLTFVEDNPVSRAVRHYFRRYCLTTGLDEALLDPLCRLHLLARAARETGERRSAWLACERVLSTAQQTVFDRHATAGPGQ